MRPRRELAAMAAEAEGLPDAWSEAAGVVRAELGRRERRRAEVRRVIAGLPAEAWCLIGLLHGIEHGCTYLERLQAVVPAGTDFERGFAALCDSGLLEMWFARDQDGDPVEVIVSLRYDVEMPEAE